MPVTLRLFAQGAPDGISLTLTVLVALVAEHLKSDPYGGDVYVFRAKRKDRLKLLVFDGSDGACDEVVGSRPYRYTV